MLKKILTLYFFLFVFIGWMDGAPSIVIVEGNQLKVQKPGDSESKVYNIKGVTWYPATRAPDTGENLITGQVVPYGFFQEKDYEGKYIKAYEVFTHWAKEEILNHYPTDVGLLKQMNANTVRLYMDFQDDLKLNIDAYKAVLDQFYANNIMVIMTVAASKTDFGGYFNIYTESEDPNNHFFPSGWVGNLSSLTMNQKCTQNPANGRECIQLDFAGGDWAGIQWQYPNHRWDGPQPWPQGLDLTKFNVKNPRLKFKARGAVGGETVSFEVGSSESSFFYSFSRTLTSSWQEYTVNLATKNFSDVRGGFTVVFPMGPAQTIYLDELRFENYDGPNTVNQPAPRYRAVVDAFKDHPAILAWCLGNEWNLNQGYGYNTLEEAAAAFDGVAQDIKSRDPNHPVFSILGDVFYPVSNPNIWTISDCVAKCPSVDAWGLNVYRGITFADLFYQWQQVMDDLVIQFPARKKTPMFVSECGIDSYQTTSFSLLQGYKVIQPIEGYQDEDRQRDYFRSLWEEISKQLSAQDPLKICMGGIIHSFNNHVFKAGNLFMGMDGMKDLNGTSYKELDPEGFYLPGNLPDGVLNEENFGVVNEDKKPKKIFYKMLEKFDESDLSKFRYIKNFPVQKGSVFAVQDPLLFLPYELSSTSAKLDIFNLSDPNDMVLIGSVSFSFTPYDFPPAYPTDILIKDHYAYIAMGPGGGIVIVDFSDPTHPFVANPNDLNDTTKFLNTYGLSIDNNILYVSRFRIFNEGRLWVLDISNPLQPQEIAQINLSYGGPGEVLKKDQYLYIPCNLSSFNPITGITSFQGDIDIVDVSNPSVPIKVNTFQIRDSHTTLGGIVGNWLYTLSDNSKGIRAYDITNPVNPILINELNMTFPGLGFENPISMKINGTKLNALFRNEERLVSFNIQDPTHPMIESILPLTGSSLSRFYYTGDRLYLLGDEGFSLWGNILTAPFQSDVSLLNHSYPFARPGFDLNYKIIYSNNGSFPAENTVVKNFLPLDVQFVRAVPSPAYVDDVNHVLIWDKIGTLTPGSKGEIDIFTKVKIGTALNTILNNQSTIQTTSNEASESNNLCINSRTVMGSYDPNDKVVNPNGFIKNTDELFYVIHYENEGNAEAIFIRIEDELSPLLDDSTLTDISDNGTYDPATRKLTWFFENINLAPGATAYVSFRINPVKGLLPGKEIKNKALITFDYNEPMQTPETLNIIGTPKQIENQTTLQDLIKKTSWLLEEMSESKMPGIENASEKLIQSMNDLYGVIQNYTAIQDPWKEMNQFQSNLDAVKNLITENPQLPGELKLQWTRGIEYSMNHEMQTLYSEIPLSNAGPDQVVEATGSLTQVFLGGSGSYSPNPQDLIQTYQWYDAMGNLVAQGETPGLNLAIGEYQYHLIVNNGKKDSLAVNQGTQDDAYVIITIQDTTPPTITVPESIPVEAQSKDGASAQIPCKVTDLVDPNPVITSNTLDIYPIGETLVTFSARDLYGNTSTATTKVIVKDTTPPELKITGITGNQENLGQNEYGSNAAVVISFSVTDKVDSQPKITSNVGVVDSQLGKVTIPPGSLLGPVEVIITAKDQSGNTALVSTKIKMIYLVKMILKPECLNIKNGTLVAFVEFQSPYLAKNIVNAACDGAKMIKKIWIPYTNMAILFFKAKDLQQKPMDLLFVVKGEFSHHGNLYPFQGSDRIKKILNAKGTSQTNDNFIPGLSEEMVKEIEQTAEKGNT